MKEPKPDGKAAAYLASFDATRRGSVIKLDKDGNMIVVSEVPPDAVVTSVTELTAKVGGKLDAEAAAKFAEAVTTLGRRTAAVNILRDALYRLGEMQSNKTLTPEAKELFVKVLEVATVIAVAEGIDSSADLIKRKEQLAKELQKLNLSPEETRKILNLQ